MPVPAKQVFLQVCDLGPEARRKRLEELCGVDQTLRQEVERLLRYDSPVSVFDSSAPDGGATSGEYESPVGSETAGEIVDPWIGRTIQSYKLLASVGKGGMGEVYRAEDIRLKRPVAVKFLGPHLLRDDRQKRRFLREAQAAAALDHPSICPVYDVGEIEGHPYIVSAFVQGENLADVIRSCGLSATTAIDYAIQIGEGLQAAHLQGIVHRDIKPGNIILASRASGDPRVKIIDFGLARVSGSTELTELGRVIGTAAYIAPEILQGQVVDVRADLWSLGVMLYEMLAGEPPFDAENRERLFYLICHEEPAPLTAVRPTLPDEAARIAAKALEKDRAQRYQTAGELLADLAELRPQVSSEEVAPVRRAPATRTSMPAARISRARSTSVKTLPSSRGPLHAAEALLPAVSAREQFRRRWALAVFALVALAAGLVFVGVNVNRGPVPPAARFVRVGILPFEDLSLGESNERIGRGIEESLAIRLAGLTGTRVVSRSSVANLQEQRVSTRDIITSLRLDYLVTGSVTRSDNNFRTTVNLISGEDDSARWSKSVDFQWMDILRIQSELAETVVREMGVMIVAPGDRPAGETEASGAYDSYLKARFSLLQFRNTRQQEFVEQAERRLRRALELDPDLIDAMTGMVELRLVQLYPPRGDREFLLSDAAEWLDRAKSKDPRHPETNRLEAAVWLERGDSLRGLAPARTAVQNAPGDGEAHYRLGGIYSALGYYESAMAENEKAIAGDLPSVDALASQVWHLANVGRFQEAEAGLQQLLSFDAESIAYPLYAPRIETLQGRYEKAIEIFEADGRMKIRGGGVPFMQIGIALARAASGDTDAGRAVLQKHAFVGIRGSEDIILLATVLGDAETMVKLTRESPFYNSYRWVVGNPFIDKIKNKRAFRDLVFDLHKTWEANLAQVGPSLPVPPPILPGPEEVLAASR